MKKTYEFKAETEKFILVNTNPNDKGEPFTIDKKKCSLIRINFISMFFLI
ncbi:hypothetical protein C823_005299 [Eubacterium plexicaudatum ASF492]|nr:hypothetical protein C823_005299 [Eubacterium plexicaudatum ASF492]